MLTQVASEASIGAPLARTVAVEVLNGRFVAPGDFADVDPKDGGNLLPFRGTRGPTAKGYGSDAPVVEAGALGKLGNGELVLLAEVGNGVWHG